MQRVGKQATFSIRPIANWLYCDLYIGSNRLCYNLKDKQAKNVIYFSFLNEIPFVVVSTYY